MAGDVFVLALTGISETTWLLGSKVQRMTVVSNSLEPLTSQNDTVSVLVCAFVRPVHGDTALLSGGAQFRDNRFRPSGVA